MGAVHRVEEAHIARAGLRGHGHVTRQRHRRLEADVGIAGGDVTRQAAATCAVLCEGARGRDVTTRGRSECARIRDGRGTAHCSGGIDRQVVACEREVTRQIDRATQGGGSAAGLLGQAGRIQGRQCHILCGHHVHRVQGGDPTHRTSHGHIAGTGSDREVACRGVAVDGRTEAHITSARTRVQGRITGKHGSTSNCDVAAGRLGRTGPTARCIGCTGQRDRTRSVGRQRHISPHPSPLTGGGNGGNRDIATADTDVTGCGVGSGRVAAAVEFTQCDIACGADGDVATILVSAAGVSHVAPGADGYTSRDESTHVLRNEVSAARGDGFRHSDDHRTATQRDIAAQGADARHTTGDQVAVRTAAAAHRVVRLAGVAEVFTCACDAGRELVHLVGRARKGRGLGRQQLELARVDGVARRGASVQRLGDRTRDSQQVHGAMCAGRSGTVTLTTPCRDGTVDAQLIATRLEGDRARCTPIGVCADPCIGTGSVDVTHSQATVGTRAGRRQGDRSTGCPGRPTSGVDRAAAAVNRRRGDADIRTTRGNASGVDRTDRQNVLGGELYVPGRVGCKHIDRVDRDVRIRPVEREGASARQTEAVGIDCARLRHLTVRRDRAQHHAASGADAVDHQVLGIGEAADTGRTARLGRIGLIAHAQVQDADVVRRGRQLDIRASVLQRLDVQGIGQNRA